MNTDPIPTPRCDAQSYHDAICDQMAIPAVLGEQLETENVRLLLALEETLWFFSDCAAKLGRGQRCTRKHCPACDARLLMEELAGEEKI